MFIYQSISIFFTNHNQYYKNNNFFDNRVCLLFPHLNICININEDVGGWVFVKKKVPAKLSI
jgi:hypothetical protein